MLKKTWKLLVMLGAMVYTGSACVTPTHASSAFLLPSLMDGVIITHIYPATAADTAHELVVLYNNSDADITITDWCVVNKNNHPLLCFNDQRGDEYGVAAYSWVVIASIGYKEVVPEDVKKDIDYTFNVAHKTNGSIIGGADTISLRDSLGMVVDSWSWSKAVPKGSGYIRTGFNEDSLLYEGSFTDPVATEPFSSGWLYPKEEDNRSDLFDEILFELRLSELLPDPDGSDEGSEFIELYNPTEFEIDLSAYRLLVKGGVSNNVYNLPDNSSILPGEYKAFSNDQIRFTLNNSAGVVELLLASKSGEHVIVNGVAYEKPQRGLVWALFREGDVEYWRYSSSATPNAANIFTLDSEEAPAIKTCGNGQYLNEETNRCRKIASATIPVACKSGQYRSAETGRCRNLIAANVPTPCKVGQERNPETNRCRNSKKMTKAGDGVAPQVATKSGGVAWYAWVVVGGIVAAVLTYAAWEWRYELRTILRRLQGNSSS